MELPTPEKVTIIKLEPNEKLLVKLPEGEVNAGTISAFARNMNKMFGEGNVMVYVGDLEFTKVKVNDETDNS